MEKGTIYILKGAMNHSRTLFFLLSLQISQEYPHLLLKLNTEDRVQRIFFVLHVVARIHNDRRRGRQCTKAKGIASQKPQTPRRLETISRQIELAERMEVIEQVDSDFEGPDSETVSHTTLRTPYYI